MQGTAEGSGQQVTGPNNRPSKGLLIAVLVGLLLLGGSFVAGNVLGDDSSEVSDLKDEVSSLSADLDDAESDLNFVEEELDLNEEQKRNLANQIKAEENLSGDVEEIVSGSGSAPEADYLPGVAGTVGDLVIKPSLELEASSEEEATWYATFEVKNNGSNPVELFCGGSEATLVDAAGRNYEGEGVLASNTANCGNAIQPGLTIDNYVVEFTTPADAEPALIEVAGGEYGEGPTKSWGVEAGE